MLWSSGRFVGPNEHLCSVITSDLETLHSSDTSVEPADSLARSRQKLAIVRDPAVKSIVDRLGLADATAAEVAADLDLPVERVRRHLRKMTRSGLVERRQSEGLPGPSRYLYSFDPSSAILSPGELSALPEREVEGAHPRLLRTIHDEALASIEAGRYGSRPDFVAARSPLGVDDTSLRRVGQLHDDLLDEVIAIIGRAKARLAESPGGSIEAIAALILVPYPRSIAPPSLPTAGPREPRGRRLSTRTRVDLLSTVPDPRRQSIIELLCLGPASCNEMAERLGLSVEICRSEMKRLLDLGWIYVHEQRQSRGTFEYVYGFDGRDGVMSADDVATYRGARLDSFLRKVLSLIFRDALAAYRSRSFPLDGDCWHHSRLRMRVDELGFKEVSEALTRRMYDLFEIRDQSVERALIGRPDPTVVTSGLLLFERAF
jgi:predicted ArsR family transcriptional regulator